jgi:hypothetical protein
LADVVADVWLGPGGLTDDSAEAIGRSGLKPPMQVGVVT